MVKRKRLDEDIDEVNADGEIVPVAFAEEPEAAEGSDTDEADEADEGSEESFVSPTFMVRKEYALVLEEAVRADKPLGIRMDILHAFAAYHEIAVKQEKAQAAAKKLKTKASYCQTALSDWKNEIQGKKNEASE